MEPQRAGGEGGGAPPIFEYQFTPYEDPFADNFNMQIPSNDMNTNNLDHIDVGSSSGSPQPKSAEDVTVSESTPAFSGALEGLLHEQHANFPSAPIDEPSFSAELEEALRTVPHIKEILELGSTNGDNWPSQNQANSAQNFMPGNFRIPSYQSSNHYHPAMYAQNEEETPPPYSFTSLLSSAMTPPQRSLMMALRRAAQPIRPQQNVGFQQYPQVDQSPMSLTLGHSQYGPNSMINQQQFNSPFRHRAQVFWSQNNQVMSNHGVVKNPWGDNPWGNFIPYGAQIRPQDMPLLNQQHQLNQVQPPNTFGSQSHYLTGISRPLGPPLNPKSLQEVNGVTTQAPWILESSMAARVQPLQQGQSSQSQAAATLLDTLHPNSITPNPIMQSGLPPVQRDETPNQSTIPSDSSSPRSGQIQNFSTEKGTAEQQGYAGKRPGKQHELEESLSLVKRSKRNSTATEVNRGTLESQQKEGKLFSTIAPPSKPRGIKNSLYDPAFERMGLPVDPHLRMFQLYESKQCPPKDK